MTEFTKEFRAFRIHQNQTKHQAGIEKITLDQINSGEVLIRVAFSSVNYKDALAGTGKGKILRTFPLVGGIDVAGIVVDSSDARFKPGDEVLTTGSGLSETRDGGYSEYVKLESKWLVPLPTGLNLREAMILGTAGFTAALALYRMECNGQTPELGPIVVTGATGGVGSLAINLLSAAGYDVHAISGKTAQFDYLKHLGAKQCIARQDLYWGQRPLENATWAGAIDNIGGDTLAGLTRVIKPYGNIAVCGMADSAELQTTVMPMIIRGVSLLGIASAGTAYSIRRLIWERLASNWKPASLDLILQHEITLDELPSVFDRMLAGDSHGRTIVRL